MRPSTLIVHRCERIKNMRYKVSSHTQIIIGSNMSGKSTLMRMLVPWPLDRKMFLDGGYATLNLTHHGHKYMITSAREKYSFIRDDVELNEMGRIGIQSKLSLEHFGLTQKLVDLLLGYHHTNFTNLSDTARRDWAISLSKIDYAYVLDMHGKVKKDLTYCKNITKHQTEQLSELGSVPNISSLTRELDELNTYAQLLEPIADYNTSNIVQLKYDLDESHTKLAALTALIPSYKLPNDIDAVLEETGNELHHCSEDVERLVSEIHEHEILLVSKVTSAELADMESERDGLIKQQSQHTRWTHDEPYQEVTKTVIKIKDDLEHYYGLDVDKPIAELRDIVEEHTMITKRRADLEEILAIDESLLACISNVEHTCPNCDSTFIDIDASEINAKDRLRQTKTELGSMIEHSASFTEMMVTHLNAQAWHSDTQSAIYPWGTHDSMKGLHTIIRDLESNEFHCSYDVRIDKINSRINHVKEIDMDKYNSINAAIDKLTKVLHKRSGDSITINNKHEEYVTHSEKRDKLIEYAELYRDQQYACKDIHSNLMYTVRANSACHELDTARQRIRELTSDIQRHEHKLNTITELEASLLTLTKEREALDTLVKALSPQAGLIAHTLKTFHGYFVKLVNTYISHIWSKELTVSIPVNKQMYPTRCNTDSDDIKETSLGMQEILNLAFRLSILKLALPDFPIMLDEVGVHLDARHRKSMYEYINDMLFNQYPNAFIISHYKTLYSMFSNDTEFVVLDSNNIDTTLLPVQPNTGLEFV